MKQGFLKRAAIVCLLSVTALCGCSGGTEKTEVAEVMPEEKEITYTEISMSEAMEMMSRSENYIILDVRTEEEFKQGHIPDAVCIPNEVIEQRAETELPDKEQLLLVYCRSGNRSKQASRKLVALGYTNVYEFGGIKDWAGKIVYEE
ncbi:MAG: rhodanese-like domain-containing protein [Ruminiclostridium sp.]